MKQKFLDARKDLVENARQAALESAINLVQNKLEQEAAERADARKREEQERQTALAEKKAEEEEEGEQKEGGKVLKILSRMTFVFLTFVRKECTYCCLWIYEQ